MSCFSKTVEIRNLFLFILTFEAAFWRFWTYITRISQTVSKKARQFGSCCHASGNSGVVNKSPVLAFLVINHEIRDFELDPRDKNFCSVTSHEPLKVRDFGKFPKKLEKSSNFAQKVIISVTKKPKINSDQNFFHDFSAILRSFTRDFRDFWLKIFVIFGLKSRDFQEKSSANTANRQL